VVFGDEPTDMEIQVQNEVIENVKEFVYSEGHTFMKSQKIGFRPLSTCVHMGRTPALPCERPHAVDMK